MKSLNNKSKKYLESIKMKLEKTRLDIIKMNQPEDNKEIFDTIYDCISTELESSLCNSIDIIYLLIEQLDIYEL